MQFRSKVPLIRALASRALRDRHWAQLLSRCVDKGQEGHTLEDDFSLQQLLDLGLERHMRTIGEISAEAEKEYALECLLQGMKTQWQSVAYDVVPYKATGSYVIRKPNTIHELLDDHLIKTQTMRGSPFVRYLDHAAAAWEEQLHYHIEMLEEWLAYQRTWMYVCTVYRVPLS